jgi:protein-disulfide isomerase
VSAVNHLLSLVLSFSFVASASSPIDSSVDRSGWGGDNAPVVVVLYSDFECPFCAKLARVLADLPLSYQNEVRLIFKNSPLTNHSRAPLAHQAALAAGEQGRFREMHDLIFSQQKDLSRENLLAHAKSIGLDMDQFKQALDSQRFRPIVERDRLEAKAIGITGTPHLYINGKSLSGAQSAENLMELIDRTMGRPKAPLLPLDLTSLRSTNSPVRGPVDAPMEVILFSDFECYFCGQAESVFKEFRAKHPGSMKLIYKHFPLSFHKSAQLAHEAALAAGAQNKFWEMHDLLFVNQKSLDRPSLETYAKLLNLDMDQFRADLDSRKFRIAVEKDQAQGQKLEVDGTPFLLINGKPSSGAPTLAQLESAASLPNSQNTKPQIIETTPTPLFLSKGSKDAPIVVDWFSDIESPLSLETLLKVEQLLDTYPNKVRFQYRHRPKENHREAMLAHQALMAAGLQNKFWEMHQMLSTSRHALSEPEILTYAQALQLDVPKFTADLQDPQSVSRVAADIADARRRDVRGTPTFFINGKRLDGNQPLAYFQTLIDQELNRK